ncbi:MAG: YbhB/YbcL family Raf kinase inhibitor-like protein [candidate division WOR-3 bacterium]|nr:MAG: YbhB/YbcL family Raf kinase inhibitor-like protein [candidate division WOR-3 bacterium]
MQLTSSAFTDGQTMPKQYTGDGKNISPPLAWTDPPEGTRSFALICNDPDAPRGDFIHWVIYNLGPETTTLNSGMPRNQVFEDGSGQGTNSFGRIGYDGPLPPPGKPHRYFFNLYALDIVLSADDPPGDAAAAMKAMEGHVLATATLMGLYGR